VKNKKILLLVIAVILLIPLFIVIRSQAGKPASTNTLPVSVSRMPPTDIFIVPFIPATATVTPTFVLPTAAPVVANGKEPPPCTFPLAQIKTVASAPDNYTFSEPKVVLTAVKGNIYYIDEWVPNNKQILMTEVLYNNAKKIDGGSPEAIELFNPETGEVKVYASRRLTFEPPLWQPVLNAVVYPIINYFDINQQTGTYKFSRQLWVSYGNPDNAQMLVDKLPMLPIVIKPGGSETVYLSDKELIKLDKSLNDLSIVPIEPARWDYARRQGDETPIIYEMAWQSGTSLIFLYNNGSSGEGGYTFILNADTGQVCELKFGGWAITAHWSSDGRYLAILRAKEYYFPIHTSDLTVLDTTTGTLTSLDVMPQDMAQHYVNDFIWAPDNRHLLVLARAILSQDNQGKGDIQILYLVDFLSGQSVNIIPTYKTRLNSSQIMAWSPDGTKLVIRCPVPGVDRLCLISVQRAGQ